jgi:hypothetical protein
VLEVFVLKEGMRFDELDDAYELYCDYAKLLGFDVRKNRKRTQVCGTCATRKDSGQANLLIKKTERGQCE